MRLVAQVLRLVVCASCCGTTRVHILFELCTVHRGGSAEPHAWDALERSGDDAGRYTAAVTSSERRFHLPLRRAGAMDAGKFPGFVCFRDHALQTSPAIMQISTAEARGRARSPHRHCVTASAENVQVGFAMLEVGAVRARFVVNILIKVRFLTCERFGPIAGIEKFS